MDFVKSAMISVATLVATCFDLLMRGLGPLLVVVATGKCRRSAALDAPS